MSKQWWLLALWAGSSLVMLQACGDSGTNSVGDNPEAGFVGSVEGTDAFIAIVPGDNSVAAYVCNGDEEIADYFWGTVDTSDSFELSSQSGARLEAKLVDGVFTGSFTSEGASHAFSAPRGSGGAGLFVVVGENAIEAGVSAGWIIDNEGNQRGALLRRDRFQPTPTFDRNGLRLNNKGFAVAQVVVRKRSVEAANIIAPDSTVAPNNIIAADHTLRVPSPAGPIPIPLPNTATVFVASDDANPRPTSPPLSDDEIKASREEAEKLEAELEPLEEGGG